MRACLKTGAQTTVVDLYQAVGYCGYVSVEVRTKQGKKKYKCKNYKPTAIDPIVTRALLKNSSVITKQVAIVNTVFPFPIGANFLDKYNMYVIHVSNQLVRRQLQMKISIFLVKEYMSLGCSKNKKYYS